MLWAQSTDKKQGQDARKRSKGFMPLLSPNKQQGSARVPLTMHSHSVQCEFFSSTCATRVRDHMGAADLADARHFAQGQGLHKLLDSCGLIRKDILPIGLVDV